MDVLSLIHEARHAYGLRHGDYQRYRQYCAHKVRRLRKTLNFIQKGKQFSKKTITSEQAKDVRFLQLILFDCERAWAMAMELKEYVRDEPRKQHHMIKRLRKAAELAQQLNTLCQIDTRTDLDVKAYAATMQGLLAVEERAWSDGLKHLTLAKCIYEHMANTGTAYQENLCQAAIDQIEPSIRLCTYHLRLRQDVASSVQDQVEEQVKTLPTLTATTPKTVYATLEWRSETVEVEPALEAALAKARKAMAEFQQSVDEQQDKHASNDIAVRYEAPIDALQQLERAAKRLIKEDEAAIARVKSSKSDRRSAALRRVHDYAVYRRLQYAIRRQLALARSIEFRLVTGAQSTKWGDVIKLLDDVLQHIASIQRLATVKEDVILMQATEMAELFYQAERSRCVARAYASEKQFVEAFAVLNRARGRLGRAHAEFTQQGEDALLSEEDLSRAKQAVQASHYCIQAAWTMYNASKGANTQSDQHLSQSSLEQPVTSSDADESVYVKARAATLPPTMAAVPVKPIFFDLALNHIDYDRETIARRAGKRVGSLGGLFGGLWGRR